MVNGRLVKKEPWRRKPRGSNVRWGREPRFERCELLDSDAKKPPILLLGPFATRSKFGVLSTPESKNPQPLRGGQTDRGRSDSRLSRSGARTLRPSRWNRVCALIRTATVPRSAFGGSRGPVAVRSRPRPVARSGRWPSPATSAITTENFYSSITKPQLQGRLCENSLLFESPTTTKKLPIKRRN